MTVYMYLRFQLDHYHLQTKLRKGNVLRLPVSHSVHHQSPWTDTHPPTQTPPTQTPPTQISPYADTPLHRHTPTWIDTTADGTHPTGMHSCFEKKLFTSWNV